MECPLYAIEFLPREPRPAQGEKEWWADDTTRLESQLSLGLGLGLRQAMAAYTTAMPFAVTQAMEDQVLPASGVTGQIVSQ